MAASEMKKCVKLELCIGNSSVFTSSKEIEIFKNFKYVVLINNMQEMLNLEQQSAKKQGTAE